MPALTIKNIPDNLYARLKEAAHAHHRSMNSEILYCVERTLCPHKIDVSEHIAVARTLRAKTTDHPLTDDKLIAAKNEGRP
ncbi:FitA-like ribbon-helix-helix domain-containing protein [endosymbiont of Lamellibrachia barhami]|uniref:FitA-like ribbon-helix-helix domain-containing protein n=1 Tax=endosymbiont of Lamellibrachia barhami TaxID=205975 RepID=UPI0015ADF4EC